MAVVEVPAAAATPPTTVPPPRMLNVTPVAVAAVPPANAEMPYIVFDLLSIDLPMVVPTVLEVVLPAVGPNKDVSEISPSSFITDKSIWNNCPGVLAAGRGVLLNGVFIVVSANDSISISSPPTASVACPREAAASVAAA